MILDLKKILFFIFCPLVIISNLKAESL